MAKKAITRLSEESNIGPIIIISYIWNDPRYSGVAFDIYWNATRDSPRIFTWLPVRAVKSNCTTAAIWMSQSSNYNS